MKRVLIVESNTPRLCARAHKVGRETASEAFISTFKSFGASLETEIFAPYSDQPPPDFSEFDGAIFTGSGVTWRVDDSRALPLARAMEGVFNARIPVFGSCNGMQLGAVVLGGSVRDNLKGPEYGVARDIYLTPQGQAHPMMTGRKDVFFAPAAHMVEVETLPKGAVLLASNALTPVQAYSYDIDGLCFWATQYHPEFTLLHLSKLFCESDLPLDEINALAVAEENEEIARGLGADFHGLAPAQRALELVNWLQYIAETGT